MRPMPPLKVASFSVKFPAASRATNFGLPVWPIFIILGIDELMDMARTAINVIGNCLATVVIAKWEGEFNAENSNSHPLPE